MADERCGGRKRRWAKGVIPSLVCEGRPGFFQNRRLREPPEIHRGHKLSCYNLADGHGFYGPTVADGQFNLQAFGVPSLGDPF